MISRAGPVISRRGFFFFFFKRRYGTCASRLALRAAPTTLQFLRFRFSGFSSWRLYLQRRYGGRLQCPLIDQAAVQASYDVRRCVGWSIRTRSVVWWTRDQLLRSLGTQLDVTKKSRRLRVENSGPLSSQNMILGVFEMPDWWYLMWYSQSCPWRLSKNRPLSRAPL